MDARLARLSARAHNPPLNAVVLAPNGFTVGKGSLVNELLQRAGLVNLATRLGIDNYLQIPLEAVALQQADVLILNGESDGAPSLATEALHHPIVAKLGERLKAGFHALAALDMRWAVGSRRRRAADRRDESVHHRRDAVSALETQRRIHAMPMEVERYWRLVAALAVAALAHDDLVGLRRLCASRRPAGVLGCPARRAKPAGAGVDPASPSPRSPGLFRRVQPRA